MQTPPQSVRPCAAQSAGGGATCPVQVPPMQASPAAHATPQPLQLAASVDLSAQKPRAVSQSLGRAVLSGRHRGDAQAAVALLAGEASQTAAAAVCGVGECVDANAAAIGLRALACSDGCAAETSLTILAGGAGDSAETAVRGIDIQVGADATAVDLPVRAWHRGDAAANAFDAANTGGAGIEAIATVGRTRHQLGAVAAIGLARGKSPRTNC